MEYRNKTWFKFRHLIFGSDTNPTPFIASGLKAVAPLFKGLGYRSFHSYSSNIKPAHINAGHGWADQLDQVCAWANKSVLRGIGPARQSAPLKLALVLGLERSSTPFTPDGP